MKQIVSLLLLIGALALTGCNQESTYSRYQRRAHQVVKVYKQKQAPTDNQAASNSGNTAVVNNNSSGNDWLFWYVMCYNHQYYYFSSPTYVSPSSYSSANWQSSKTPPPIEVEPNANPNGEVAEGKAVEVEEQTVPNSELGEQVDNVIETQENTAQQEADMISEGNPNNAEPSSGESSGGEAGGTTSSDSGSSGGDSGGGGGGGGGE